MSIVPAFLNNLFERQSAALSWEWIPDGHVVDAALKPVKADPPFVISDDYVVLRLAEMYLKRSRLLWREYYPLVHAFVAYGDVTAQRSLATVAGPGQLKDLGTENLERLIGLAYRLAGPLVYDGQDIELLAGLYAVPSKDGAKLLIDTLAQLSGLIPVLQQATEVAGIVKGGVEGVLGLSGTNLTLGIHYVLRNAATGGGRSARPGFMVAINAPAGTIDPASLWVKEGRLVQGPNPMAAQYFTSQDMMLFELHRGPSRVQVWATLPQLVTHAEAFDLALKEFPVESLPGKLNELFRRFESDLGATLELTRPDKSAIRAVVADDLQRRVENLKHGQLFQTRSFGTAPPDVELRRFSPQTLDLPAGGKLPIRDEGVPIFS